MRTWRVILLKPYLATRRGMFALLAAIAAGPLALASERGSTQTSSPSSSEGTDALPLRAARVVRFRTAEGTWMSLDVSPDGRTIVFELLGDLYTLPIAGGQAQRLTSGMAFNCQPRYSPDGRHLAFVSDRGGSANVWVADADGSHARQLSNLHGYTFGAVTSPAWSPDGRSIVVSQMLGATRPGPVAPSQQYRWLLAIYDTETGRMRWVSDTTAARARAALGGVFSPDGSAIYAAIDAFEEGHAVPENWRIMRVDLASGRFEPEMPSQVGRVGMRPAISHNGRYLAYATSSGSHFGLRVRDFGTDREWWLVREVLDDTPIVPSLDSRDLVPGYAFTPDSKSLVAAYGGKIHRVDLLTGRASVIPFFAEVSRGLGPLAVHQFTLPDTAMRTRSVMQPALSPDGQRVAFSALDRIWVLDLPQHGKPVTPPSRLTDDSMGEFYPSWSPDGQWIAYSTWKDGEGGAVRRAYVVPRANGEHPPSERLTVDTALYFHTTVAADGQRVIAVRGTLPRGRALTWNDSGDSLRPALVWISTTGGMPRTITSLAPEQHEWGHPRYPVDQLYLTNDPDRIYVGLTSWSWRGGDRRAELGPITRAAFDPRRDVDGVISYDGQRALVTYRYGLFEAVLRAARGGGPDTLDLEQAQGLPFVGATRATRRWGTALSPWVSWSHDARRVLFNQGGTLFVGDVSASGWTTFTRVDVPLPIPVDIPRGTMVLHGARLITMRGQEVIERGDVVVRDNRITAVGATGRVAIPTGARVLDVSGTTILPGYVDLHDHMVLPKGIHPEQCAECLARLAYGVTTSRDPQPIGNDVFTYRERERAGALLGPRLFATGLVYNTAEPPIRTLHDARQFLQPYVEYFGSETFKIHTDPAAGRRTWQLLAMAAAEEGLNATVHAMATEQHVIVALDGFSGLEHMVPIRIYDDVATLIARSGTTHTQTFGVGTRGGLQYMFRHYGGLDKATKLRRFAPPLARAFVCPLCAFEVWNGRPELANLLPLISNAARISARGGNVGMGSHGEIPGLGAHYELWFYALGGMPNHEILRSATIVGATAIGHANDFGSLEPGKLADLQVLDKNPLEDIHNTTSIRYVMKNGRLYQADDLTEIWPERKPLPKTYIWDRSSADSTQAATAPHR